MPARVNISDEYRRAQECEAEAAKLQCPLCYLPLTAQRVGTDHQWRGVYAAGCPNCSHSGEVNPGSTKYT
jgi:hypothetical protein